jgi:hypothetical protein
MFFEKLRGGGKCGFVCGFAWLLIGVTGCSYRAPIAVSAGELRGLRSSVVNEEGLRSVNTISIAPVIVGQSLPEGDAQGLTIALVEAMNAEWGDAAFLGDSARADAVLEVHVRELSPPDGSAVGAQKTAQVAADMKLKSVSSSRPLWQGDYVFHDRALSENWLDISKRREGGGSGWKKSRELLIGAFQAVARDLATRREELFMRSSTTDAR